MSTHTTTTQYPGRRLNSRLGAAVVVLATLVTIAVTALFLTRHTHTHATTHPAAAAVKAPVTVVRPASFGGQNSPRGVGSYPGANVVSAPSLPFSGQNSPRGVNNGSGSLTGNVGTSAPGGGSGDGSGVVSGPRPLVASAPINYFNAGSCHTVLDTLTGQMHGGCAIR
jgi:hypothetical protein